MIISHCIPKTQCLSMMAYQTEETIALQTKYNPLAKACLEAKRNRGHKDEMEESRDKKQSGYS